MSRSREPPHTHAAPGGRVRPWSLGLLKVREFEFPEPEKAFVSPKIQQSRGKLCIGVMLRNTGAPETQQEGQKMGTLH